MKLSKPTIEEIRHSLAHLLAASALKKYPDAKLGVGPVVENGFYYDIVFPSPISPDDLKDFESDIKKWIKEGLPFEGREVTPQEAHKLFANQPFKRELIEEYSAEGRKLTVYKTGGIFEDLCRGGHVKNTSEIDPDSFKLDKIAGAYWKGDEKNPQMTRIYGLAFTSKKELDAYLSMREEAEKRDHRKLGRELDLFTFSDLVGSGLPLYTPRGMFIRRSLLQYIEGLQSKAGYTQVWTPQIAKAELFKISGHYDKYKDSMFRVSSNYSEEEFFLKPMNCPQHTQIYASKQRSYRDLPFRYTDFAMLYRDEKPGELNGLARTRSFSQDDCHIFCREDQVDQEIDVALAMTKEVMKTFGFKYRYRLSTRDKEHPEKWLGDPKTWDKVEKWAEKIMQRNGIEYFDGPGEAAFYAPKMDLMATDALGREWQLSTVQIDFVQPERFNLSYIGEDGQKKRPVMIHRAIIGSPERFMMVLLEHFAGALPVWLSPVQVKILPVSEKFLDYGHKLEKELLDMNVRVELSDVNETLGKRIREAEMQKIPYILVVGEKEEKGGSVNVRPRQPSFAEALEGKQEGEMDLEKFLDILKEEVREKKI